MPSWPCIKSLFKDVVVGGMEILCLRMARVVGECASCAGEWSAT